MQKDELDKLTELIEISGVSLFSKDGLGNTFKLSSMAIAFAVSSITNPKLTDAEKMFSFYGAIKSNITDNIISEG